jgi:hypothetical protein
MDLSDSVMQELNALRKAVTLMGFDSQKLASYVATEGDNVCKAILLSSMSLGESKLRERGASNVEGWREMLVRLQRPQNDCVATQPSK